jgi:hypothetical protein
MVEAKRFGFGRRQFIALLATAAFARPFATRAQLAPNRPIRPFFKELIASAKIPQIE